MKSETDPITDDEWLMRRVRIERFRDDKTPFILPGAFEPRIKGREPDIDGISLYREECLANPEEILSAVIPSTVEALEAFPNKVPLKVPKVVPSKIKFGDN